MPFQSSGFVQDAQRLPAKIEHVVGDDHAGRKRGGTRPQPFTDRDFVMYVKFDRLNGHARIGCHRPRSLPDQIVVARGDNAGVTSLHCHAQPVRLPKPALQINSDRQSQSIEAWAEIGTGRRYPERGPRHGSAYYSE